MDGDDRSGRGPPSHARVGGTGQTGRVRQDSGSREPSMKIAVVGGGSTYTPELVDGFARLAPSLDELALIDPASERLDVVGPFAQRIFARYGHPGKVTWTGDLDAGLTDAAAVIVQLRVGGQAARISDET